MTIIRKTMCQPQKDKLDSSQVTGSSKENAGAVVTWGMWLETAGVKTATRKEVEAEEAATLARMMALDSRVDVSIASRKDTRKRSAGNFMASPMNKPMRHMKWHLWRLTTKMKLQKNGSVSQWDLIRNWKGHSTRLVAWEKTNPTMWRSMLQKCQSGI